MHRTQIPAIAFLFCALCWIAAAASAISAQSHSNPEKRLGSVNFPTTCSPDAQPLIGEAVALLHSFQYQHADQVFSGALKSDPSCAIADWGRAMTLYHELWEFPSAESIAEGRRDIEQAQKLDAKSRREREYIAAAAVFFKVDPGLSHLARVAGYSVAMRKVYADYPQDNEAGEFYALSLVALAQMEDHGLIDRRKAIAILNPIFARDPQSPGAAHYLIHAADLPELASEGLPAARAYANIAPDSAHALHMPSHIFRQLGLWQEDIDSNLASEKAAAMTTEMKMGDANYQFHAMEFLNYAYLQSGQEEKARAILDEVKQVPGASPETVIDEQAMFAAVNALELHRWREAAELPVPQIRRDWQDVTYWTRAIGAARIDNIAGATADLAGLDGCIKVREARQQKEGNPSPPGENVDQLEAEAWLAQAEGKPAEALGKMRAAVQRDENTHWLTIALPAREMLADLLLEQKRGKEALTDYEHVLEGHPNRFDAIYGAALASQALGDHARAFQYYSMLVKISAADADRPELEAARKYRLEKSN